MSLEKRQPKTHKSRTSQGKERHLTKDFKYLYSKRNKLDCITNLKMKPVLQVTLIIAIFATLTYCSTSSQGTEKTQAELAEEKTIHDIDQLLKDFPPPSLVPFTLKSIGAAFDREHINALENATSYEGNTDKMALNMGVFASDISYLAAYGHEEDCLDYLETSHGMAEQLGDSAIYDESHLDEFRGHVKDENEKEISRLLAKLFMETSVQMEKDHHLTMAGLALTGSFVEGLYQAVITLEAYDNSRESNILLEPLVKIVLGEEKALRDVIQVLDDLPFDDTIAEIMLELGILDELYKGDLRNIEEQMANDPEFIVSKSMMRDITSEVKRIRATIVE